MIKRENNPRKQGDAGLGIAVGWFVTNGYTVCIPLTDSQGYDLVVEDSSGLHKVFVRTTTRTHSKGKIFECGLRTQGGNKSQFKIRKFDRDLVDIVFIVCGDGAKYLIPAQTIDCKSSISLGPRYQQYRLN